MTSQTAGEASRSSHQTQAPSSQGIDAENDIHLATSIHASSWRTIGARLSVVTHTNAQQRLACERIALSDPNEEDRASTDDTHAPSTPYQTSGEAAHMSSEDEQASDLEPDSPLRGNEDTNTAQSPATAENYTAWIWGGSGFRPVLPRIWIYFIGVFFVCTLFSWIFALAFSHVEANFFEVLIYLVVCVPTGISVMWFLSLMWVVVTLRRNQLLQEPTVLFILLAGFTSLFFVCLSVLFLANQEGSFTGWRTTESVQSFRGCSLRVRSQQASLFYNTQFFLVSLGHHDLAPSNFSIESFHRIQTNPTLCDRGFEGNSDLYGLGTRAGLYLQWIASLLANNFLSEKRQELQKVCLVFSLAICTATVVSSITKTCIFGIEIELLYWMYWGGFVCVFASSPSSIKLGSEIKWVRLDWITAVSYTSHMIMAYHGIWYNWYAYDLAFSRMPCGTYHFFLVAMLDPSKSFWHLRDSLSYLIAPWAFTFLVFFPFVTFLLASEIKHSIQTSAPYQLFFFGSNGSDPNPQNAGPNLPLGVRVSLRIQRLYRALRLPYRWLREKLGLPPSHRGGIYLLTPIDVKNRRKYRIRCAIFGILSYVLSISAIELILKWNRVQGVTSISSTGQYMAFTIGLASLVTIFWQLVQQEAKRRQDLRRRQRINEDADGIELQPLPNTLAQAISHAFQQPDVGFLTNGGALPAAADAFGDDSDSGSDSPAQANAGQQSGGEYYMSGALPVLDLEAQAVTEVT